MYRHLRKSSAKTRPRRFLETAQGLVEYALILALVAVLAVGATAYLGGQVGSTLSNVGGAVLGADENGPTPAPTPTPAGNPGTIHNSGDCWAAGFYWYSNSCHSTAGSASNYHNSGDCVAAGYYWYDNGSSNDCHSTPPDPSDFNNSGDCWAAGFFWYNHDCHGSAGSPNNYGNSADCQRAGFFWYGNDCHSSSQPPPPPPDGLHTVGAVCRAHSRSPDETWHWDVVWYTSNGGHWDGSWDCRV